MIETNCSDPAGPFQTQQDHFRPSRTISDPAGPFQTRQDHFRPSRTILDPAGPFQTRQDHFSAGRTSSDPAGPFQCWHRVPFIQKDTHLPQRMATACQRHFHDTVETCTAELTHSSPLGRTCCLTWAVHALRTHSLCCHACAPHAVAECPLE